MSLTPAYLFRVWSDQSNGTNTPEFFAPAASTSNPRTDVHEFNSEQLRLALLGKDVLECPFIFWTPSLLYALVVAGFKTAKGDTKIHVTCIRTSTATTSTGRPVRFHSVEDMMKEKGLEMRDKKTGTLRTYAGEWISTAALVKLGMGSSTVAYGTLVREGLFQLWPELGETQKGGNVRWYLAISDLRQYGFSSKRPAMTETKIELAVRLACAFKPITTKLAKVDAHLLAWLLALRKWGPDDMVMMKRWLDNTTSGSKARRVDFPPSKLTPVVDLTVESDEEMEEIRTLKEKQRHYAPSSTRRGYQISVADETAVIDLTASDSESDSGADADVVSGSDDQGLPEIDQFNALFNVLSCKQVSRSNPTLTSRLSPAVEEQEICNWHSWHRASRAAHRAERAEKEGWGDKSRRMRKYHERRHDRPSSNDRPRVSKEEYLAQKVAQRGTWKGRRIRDGRVGRIRMR